jgi:hypothetical protein
MSRVIDAHIHCPDSSTELMSLLEEFDLQLLNICFAADYDDDWRSQRDTYSSLQHQFPDRYAWITTVDLPPVQEPGFDGEQYASDAIASLQQDFKRGAVGCKLWKNIGMSVRRADGSFLMIDDPLFTPLFEYLAAGNHTLLMHMAEPLACWQPLDERSPHYGYYRDNPEWHMFNRPDYPSHTKLIAARDRVVEQHPNLRIVGAHLASLEYDVDEVAARLDRYPNFAVDISARLGDLALQDSDKVAGFFEAYQDQILFGTDVVLRGNLSDAQREDAVKKLRQTYEVHFAYLETEEPLIIRGLETTGLGLPDLVLEKIYRANALQWYPVLVQGE